MKADVEPPPKIAADVPDTVLRDYEGYYHQANPRNQAFAFIEWLLGGQTIAVDGKRLQATPVFGRPAPLVPVADNLFRLEADPEPTRVFATDDAGTMVLTGGVCYAERKPRWRIESVRWPVLVSAALALTPLLMMIPWIVRARRCAPKAEGVLVAEVLAAVLQRRHSLLPVIGRDERQRLRSWGRATSGPRQSSRDRSCFPPPRSCRSCSPWTPS